MHAILFVLIASGVPLPGPSPTWQAAGIETAIRIHPGVAAGLGMQVEAVDPLSGAADDRMAFRVLEGSAVRFDAAAGDLEKLAWGRLEHAGGLRLTVGQEVLSLEGFVLQVADEEPFGFDLLDAAGRRWLRVENSHVSFEPRSGQLEIFNTDLVLAPELAKRLGHPAWAGQFLGSLEIRLRATRPGFTWKAAAIPWTFGWPQDKPRACINDRTSPKDVALTGIGQVSQIRREPRVRVALAPSAFLRNAGQGTVPWFQAIDGDGPAGQHPFLALHLYRLRDGILEQIGRGDVKHAFLSINTGCPCPPGHLLFKDCADVYGVQTNADRLHLAPRDEVTTHRGDWDSTGSHFDGVLVDGKRDHGSEEDHGPWDHLLVVAERDLATPGARYFIEAWYIVQGDVNLWNSMGYREIMPQMVGGMWTFPFAGAMVQGPVLDAWVDPADRAPEVATQILDTGEGRLKLAVRSSAAAAGGTRYQYGLMNLDFDRQISSFFVPIPAGVGVSDFRFSDGDSMADNDWQAAVDSNGITWTAPSGQTLDWGTLVSFSFEAETTPRKGQATLGILEPGSGATLSAATLSPAVP